MPVDVYAACYVPRALIEVNESPATIVQGKALTTIDFRQYISTFAGSHFLAPVAPVLSLPSLNESFKVLTKKKLGKECYLDYFKCRLSIEHEARAFENRQYNMFKVPLQIIDKVQQIYTLHVPGLREGNPSVRITDTVMIRQLHLDVSTGLPYVKSTGGFRFPGFLGYQHAAVVYGIDNVKESLILQIQGLSPGFEMVNVSFTPQTDRTHALRRSLESSWAILDAKDRLPLTNSTTENVVDQSSPSEPQGEWLSHMLFPSEKFGTSQGVPLTPTTHLYEQAWFDSSLNYEQMSKEAVSAIKTRQYGTLPYLISGPPGTGKTKTIVEMTLQLVADTHYSGSILLCAPSNSAADTLALQLRPKFNPKELFRLNSPSRTFAEVNEALLPYCFVADNEHGNFFMLPPIQALMRYKVVVTTCEDADILVQARVTNTDIAYLLEHLLGAMYLPQKANQISSMHLHLHWAALLVDEAAQAMEPEILVPLTVLAPPSRMRVKGNPLFIMAGDQHQLGPRVSSRETSLDISLFERLSDLPLYKDHPRSRKSLARRHPLVYPMLHPPFTNLVRNYRSHPAILAIPSALFYEDSLVPEARKIFGLKDWNRWRGCRWPVLFSCNGGIDRCEDVSTGNVGSWYNTCEADKACTYVKALMGSGLIEQRDICIMSPFRAQVNLLRRTLRKSNLYNVNIGPMEAFQGLESRMVIVCTTRAQARFIQEDHAKGAGMVGEKKRVNVALTRAKEGLIVIGNPWVLGPDEAWGPFLAFCWRHGLWDSDEVGGKAAIPGLANTMKPVGDWKPSEADDGVWSRMSRLETQLVFQDEGRLKESYDDCAMYVGGLAAEQVLRDH